MTTGQPTWKLLLGKLLGYFMMTTGQPTWKLLLFALCNIPAPDINEANKCIMHTSIGAKLFICKLDYCSKVDEPIVLMLKKGMCVRICSKFSVKCEANHMSPSIGRVGTYRQVLHLTIGRYSTKYTLNITYYHFFASKRGSQQNQGC